MTTTTSPFATLEATIKADLTAGVSWFEDEAASAGLALWNILKGAFIALEPATAQVLVDTLTAAVTAAGTGASIENVETAALNTASTEAQAALAKAGSGVVQTIIAGIKANA